MGVVIKRNLKQYVEKIRGGKESDYFFLITKTIQASQCCHINKWLIKIDRLIDTEKVKNIIVKLGSWNLFSSISISNKIIAKHKWTQKPYLNKKRSTKFPV